ncbi:hypothetical protein O3M35_011337 [Rhynocoris fuscipes]|uniref:Pentatricopeptide repeat-containing protein n=1 Tax=Rhynocoris fuscipes TaxID=488301 RepID=A0AAW1CW81_9HEMI
MYRSFTAFLGCVKQPISYNYQCRSELAQRSYTVLRNCVHNNAGFSSGVTDVLRTNVSDKECMSSVANEQKDFKRLKETNYNRNFKEKISESNTLPNELFSDNNSDKFGTLSSESLLRKRLETVAEEEDDEEFTEFIDGKEGKTRLRQIEYAKLVKKLLNEKKLVEAVDVLETRMKTEKAKPDEFIFRLLISGCAKVGYTKKAFKLFNQMKKRGLKVKGGIYTSLFDACARSPWPEDGLKRASALWDLMIEKRVDINQRIAHAAIKAFGRCGDIERAFRIADEIVTLEIPFTSETINFLLQACASDKEAGFRHALMIWRKMLDRKITPTIFTYNLLLRCARDCSVGNLDKFREDLSSFIPSTQMDLLKLPAPNEEIEETDRDVPVQIEKSVTSDSFLPCLLSEKPHLGSVIHLKNISKSWHRLMLMGGQGGFIQMMINNGVKPDIKTFNQLLFTIAPDPQEENLLLTEMKRLNVKVDLDFYNMLIKKRNMHGRYEDAKDVLKMIREEQFTPNIVTFGVLALGCTNFKSTKTLLSDLKSFGLRLNVEILGTLLNSACRNWDFKTINFLVKLLIKTKIKPNLKFIQHLDNLNEEISKHIQIKNEGRTAYNNKLDFSNIDNELEDFKQLITHVKSLEVEDASKFHPWDQFRR